MAAGALIAAVAVFFLVAKTPRASDTSREEVYARTQPGDFAAPGFIDQDGQPFDPGSLPGKRWVINFFFTSCPGPCPMMTQKIAHMLSKDPDLRALSITSDPAVDTPAVMKAYGEKFKADFSRWSFVTGKPDAVREFSAKVLKLPLGEIPDSHSQRVAIINAAGGIVEWKDLAP
jgi:cytochrome oxidase Cu insertion factor (SCO1/SenC/PrrC family)